MSSYQQFVKAEMANLTESTMKPAEKMKHIATLWHKHKDQHSPAVTRTKRTKTTKQKPDSDSDSGGSLEGEKEQKRRTKKKPILSKEITAILDKYNC